MVTSERLIEVTPYLVQNWLPFNEPLLQQLRLSLADVKDNKQNDLLVQSLRSDPALYTYCLMLGNEAGVHGASKKRLVSEQAIAGLKKLCVDKNRALPIHQLQSASIRQQELLRNSLTRTTASSFLAPYFDVDCDSAYASNSIREVGLALIAWNYPNIFAQAEENVKNLLATHIEYSNAVDLQLRELLGFDPLDLAISLGQSFDLSTEIQLAIGSSDSDLDASAEAIATGSTLRKISEISQVFALAASTNKNESTASKWELYRQELLPILGTSGLLQLKERSLAALNTFSDILPEINSRPIHEQIIRSPEKSKTQRYLQNIHITHCNQKTQELLDQLYTKINPAVIAYANVTKLINEIAPVAGFESGAIYLINPGVHSLEPRMMLGTHTEKLLPIFYRQQEYRHNLVTVAFTGKLPVVESYQDSQLIGIAGILGDLQRVGVLFLVPKTPVEGTRQPSLRAHFKALQQTLNDCLNLN
jgi:hypothetical protein